QRRDGGDRDGDDVVHAVARPAVERGGVGADVDGAVEAPVLRIEAAGGERPEHEGVVEIGRGGERELHDSASGWKRVFIGCGSTGWPLESIINRPSPMRDKVRSEPMRPSMNLMRRLRSASPAARSLASCLRAVSNDSMAART